MKGMQSIDIKLYSHLKLPIKYFGKIKKNFCGLGWGDGFAFSDFRCNILCLFRIANLSNKKQIVCNIV